MNVSAEKRVLLLAGISTIVYIGITTTHDLREGFWAFAALYTTLFLILGWAYLYVGWNDRLIRMAFISAIVFRVVVMPLPPTLSDDAYRYLWDGKTLQHGLNPYAHTPASITDPDLARDPLRQQQKYAASYTNYPPLAQVFFAASVVLGRGDAIPSFYFLKFFFLVLESLTCWMIVSTLRRLKLPHKNALLYLWNPLIVIELVGQAHTEVIMVWGFALTVMLVSRRKYAAGAVSFALAALGKITILLYAPFLFRKIGWRWTLVSLAVAAGAVTPFYYPQLIQNYSSTLQLYFDYFAFNAGIYYALADIFRWFGLNAAVPLLGSVLGVLAGILIVLLFVKTRDSSPQDFMKHGLYAGMIFLLLTTTVHPWYLALIIIALPFVPRISVMWWALFAGWSYLAYTSKPPLEHHWLIYLCYGVLLILVTMETRSYWLKPIVKHRANWKADRILPHIRGKNILDVGAAEGWVGAELRSRRPDLNVLSIDVIRMQCTKTPAVLYDGRDLPFRDQSIDSAYTIFVLHHCWFPDLVIQEVHRVVRDRFIVIESVYRTQVHKRLLEFLDGRVNAFRSNGKMTHPLHFDTIEGWKARFASHGFTVTSFSMIKSGIHHQALFVLERRENFGSLMG